MNYDNDFVLGLFCTKNNLYFLLISRFCFEDNNTTNTKHWHDPTNIIYNQFLVAEFITEGTVLSPDQEDADISSK